MRANRLPVSARFRERVAATGATLVPFPEPAIHPLDEAPPPRGLARGWTPKRLASASASVLPWAWAPTWAENTLAELRRAPADALAVDFVLPGALAAAEAAGIPAAALMHNVYNRPAPSLPAFGHGFLPASGPLGRWRDALYNAGFRRVYRRDGLPPLNRARRALALPPLRAPLAQYHRAARVLVLASAAFDFPARRLPPNVRHVGTPFDDAGAAAWTSPWPADDPRPLVLVSLSTLPQGQGPTLHNVLAALAPLPLRALVTLGPSLDPAAFAAPANARLVSFVPHAAVLPQVAALVTQCGLGTLTKALAHGVPLVCLPILGDQPDNAARVVAREAGIRLPRDASPEQIGRAIRRVLDEPRFRAGARRLAAALSAEDGVAAAARELEALAG